jgi:hypothetical protein
MQRTSIGGTAKALFCRNIMEACEARKHGSDSKQNHQVEGAIMQAKEWTRTFGRCNPVDHTVTKQQRSMECTREKLKPKGAERTQAGLPLLKPLGAPLRQVSRSSSSLFVFGVWTLSGIRLIVQNHIRLTFPLRVCFVQQNPS